MQVVRAALDDWLCTPRPVKCEGDQSSSCHGVARTGQALKRVDESEVGGRGGGNGSKVGGDEDGAGVVKTMGKVSERCTSGDGVGEHREQGRRRNSVRDVLGKVTWSRKGEWCGRDGSRRREGPEVRARLDSPFAVRSDHTNRQPLNSALFPSSVRRRSPVRQVCSVRNEARC